MGNSFSIPEAKESHRDLPTLRMQECFHSTRWRGRPICSVDIYSNLGQQGWKYTQWAAFHQPMHSPPGRPHQSGFCIRLLLNDFAWAFTASRWVWRLPGWLSVKASRVAECEGFPGGWVWRLPGWLSGEEFTCHCRRCGFDPWVGKIPWTKKWQPTLVFSSGKFHGQRSRAGYSLRGRKESDTTGGLTTHVLSVCCLDQDAKRWLKQKLLTPRSFWPSLS